MAEVDTIDEDDLLGPDPEPAPTPGRTVARRGPGQPPKINQDRMRRVIQFISKMPVAANAALAAGISHSTLKNWLKASEEGVPGDSYDFLGFGDDAEPERFHVAYEDGKDLGVSQVEQAMFTRAIGYQEPGVFQGRVIYKQDPELLALGLTGMDAYLKDEDGRPVPESVMKQDPDLQMFIMKSQRPAVYGNRQQVDVNVRGGVLVVPATLSGEQKADLMDDYKANAIEVEFEDVAEDAT